MAITTTEQTSIIKLVLGMFNAAPGATNLSSIVAHYEANGKDLSNLADALASNAAFTDQFAGLVTVSGIANKMAANFGLTTGTAYTNAVAYFEQEITAGKTNQSIMKAAVDYLSGSTVDAVYADVVTTLTNKYTVALDYSVTKQLSAATVAELQAVVASVDATAASVTAAIAGSTSGSTYNLTAAVDTMSGTAFDDTFNAAITTSATTTTLNSFDNINGAAGTDTLNLASSTGAVFALPTSVTYAGFETVNLSHAGTAGTNALTVTNTTFGTGVTSFSYNAAGASTTAAVAVTLDSATSVSAVAGATAFTTVGITDKSTTVASTGSTLTTATVTNATGNVTLTGNAINTVNLNATAGATTVTAAAATRALTLNTNGTTTLGGVTDATATSVAITNTGAKALGSITTAKATSLTMTTSAAVSETIVAIKAATMTFDGTGLNTVTALTTPNALTSVVVKGSGGVVVDTTGAALLTSIDSSASTAVAPASGVATGANSFTIGTGTAVTGGAGSDNVNVGATTKAITLAGGNDTATVNVTALGTGGSINGGTGTDTLALTNANALTLTTTGATQTAFKAAVTGFETLSLATVATNTISMSGFGSFDTVSLTAANFTQTISGVTSGKTFVINEGAAKLASLTTNNLSAAADTMNITLRGDLSANGDLFGTVTTPGVETMNVKTVDTAATFTNALQTLTIVDTDLATLNITGNNGVAIVHTGTALTTLDASGLTKGGVTYTASVLTTDATATGSAGNDTIDLSSATSLVTITETAGTNAITGSATNKSTLTGGTGIDTIVGGANVDTITVGAGITANTVTGGAAADAITLTGSLGVDTLIYGLASTAVSATGTDVDVITNFVSGTDKIQLTAGDNSATAGTITAGGLAGINLAAGSTLGTMAATITSATSVATIAEVYTALGNDLTTANLAASATGAGNIVGQLVTYSTGAAAGTYLVLNDVTADFQAATDMVIQLTGTTTFAATDLTVV